LLDADGTGGLDKVRMLLERAAIALLAVLIVVYAGDWLVYRYRVSHGTAFDSVKVNQFMAVPLKNGKDEFDYTGSQQVGCVRALFPWGGDEPCWWVRRHAEKPEKI
jgi:hypothetical protein